MQIVIDIPEEKYKSICDHYYFMHENEIMFAIKNGTPLPKGHGALKDADKLAIAIAMIRDKCNYYGNEYEQALFQAYDICVDEIIDAHTIIEADKEYDVKAITRGNCMACGKELTEGVFFCKGCEEKGRTEGAEE